MLGLGVSIYDDLDCFAGGRKRKRKKAVKRITTNVRPVSNKTKEKTINRGYQSSVKRYIKILKAPISDSEVDKIYRLFVKSVERTGDKRVTISCEKNLFQMVKTFMSDYLRNKK